MVFNQLCPPALIYLIFSTTQVIIDSVKGLYNTALMKIWVAILFTILLNYLCSLGLGTISWLIVFIPFILMTLVVAVLLLMFGLDPKTGKLKIEDKEKHKHHKHGPEDNGTHSHGHGPHDDHGKGMEKKKEESDNTIANLGQNKLNDAKKETKQEKTDRILTRSVLFYQEQEQDALKDGMLGKKKGDTDLKGASEVSDDGTSFDANNVKLFIEDQTNLLFGMGEHEIASWYKTSALECINNLEGTTKEKQDKVTSCLEKLNNEITSKMPNLEKKQRFVNNALFRYCPDAKNQAECNESWIKNWLKFA